LPLFAAAAPRPAGAPAPDPALAAVLTSLAALHPDEMTPRDALDALYALKAKAGKADNQ
jgi:DNA mismatch repair protein MutS